MKLFSMFARPAWESADPDKRARAVSESTDTALLAKLPDLARHDADAKVRLAAVKRIDDLSLLGDRARLDLSAEVRDAAGARLRHLLLDATRPLDARVRIVRVLDNVNWLEAIACDAGEAELRACALERIRRPAFLAERCVKDPDAKLRLGLLDRIDDPAQLERIADRARKSDKQLSRLARERVQAARLAAGDRSAIEARAASLCEALEALLRARGDDAATRIAAIEVEWSRFSIPADTDLARRYQGLVDTLKHVLNPPERPQAESQPAPEVEAPRAEVAEHDAPQSPVIIAVEPDEAEPGESAKAAADAAREAEQAQRRHWRERVQEAFAKFATAIEAGKFHDARAARQTLHEIDAQWPKAKWDEAKRFAQLEGQYAQLERWQQWSQRDQKKRLCDAAEALIGSGLHPDALITRVRELQGEWDRLVASESADANEGLARRFRALIHQSMAPARPYLEKRKALRSEKGQALAANLDAIEAGLANPELGLSDLLALRSQLNEASSALSDLAGSDRREANTRRKQLLDTVQQRIGGMNNQASENKQRLIAQLRRQLASADLREQINLSKSAMAQWKSLPRGQRQAEDRLWNELRALIDPVFERDRAEHDRLRDERRQEAEAVKTVLDDLEALAESESDADWLRQKSQALRDRLRAIEGRQAADDQAFERLMTRIDARIVKAHQTRAEERRQRALALSIRLAEIEQRVLAGQDLESAGSMLDDLPLNGVAPELEPRRSAVRAAMTDPKARAQLEDAIQSQDAAAELAIQVELAAGLPSPEAWQSLRRTLQMNLLAQTLGGAREVRDAANWQADWLALPGTHGDARAVFDQRIETALDTLHERGKDTNQPTRSASSRSRPDRLAR